MEILKYITFSIFIIAFPFLGNTQTYFFKYFSSSVFDAGYGIVQLPDTSYAITGGSGAFDEFSGQAFLTLTDKEGNPIWTKNYGGDADDVGVRVAHLPGNGFYIAGYTNSTENGDYDFVVYKTDEQGNLEWEKKYGTENWEKLHDAQLLSDGSLILVGHTEGLTTQNKDIFLVRINLSGDTVWTKTIATPEDDIAYTIDTISNTEFIIGGILGDGNQSMGFIGFYDINDGSENLVTFCDDDGVSFIRDIAIYQNQVFVVGGLYTSESVTYNYDLWIAKYQMNGDFIYSRSWSYDENALLSSIAIKDYNGVYISIYSNAETLNAYPIGNDIYMMRLGSGLEYKNWTYNLSTYGEDIVNQMIITNDGGVAIIGTASESMNNEHVQALGNNIMFVKIGPDGETVIKPENSFDFAELQQEQKSILAIYPNPTFDNVYLPDNIWGLSYQIFDSQGKKIMDGVVENYIYLQLLNPGIYLLKITDNKQVITSKIIKK